MTRRTVADATPLIALTRLGLLDRLPELYDAVLVPHSVRREVVRHGKEGSKADALAVEDAFARRLLRRVRDAPVPREIPSTLGRGERAALALALRERCEILIDDKDGHLLARALGVRARRTTAFLLEGVAAGLWDARRFERHLLRLSESGYFISADVYAELVSAARKVPRRR